MKYRLIMLIAALMMLPCTQLNAEDIREVTWDDLVPAEMAFDDPFEK